MVPQPPAQHPNTPRPGPQEPHRPATGCLGHLYALIGSLLAEILGTILAIFVVLGFLLLATSKGGWALLALGGLVICALAIWGLARKPYWWQPAPQPGRWLFAVLFFGPLVFFALILVYALVSLLLLGGGVPGPTKQP